MSCDRWAEKITAYIDSEVSAAEIDGLDAHLQSCARCASEAFAQLKMRQLVSNVGKRYSPSREFKEKVRQKTFGGVSERMHWRWWPTAALAVALLLAIFIGIDYRRAVIESDRKLAEIADLHITALASATPVDVLSSDRHTVKPWFEGRIPITFNLPELQNTQFVLLGGRVAYLNQLPGAHLLYQIRKHRISVYIFQDRPELGLAHAENKMMNERSFHMESWADAGLRYYVIGDVSPEDLDSLCRLLRAAGQS
jgi:anti-sigma factor RsiW